MAPSKTSSNKQALQRCSKTIAFGGLHLDTRRPVVGSRSGTTKGLRTELIQRPRGKTVLVLPERWNELRLPKALALVQLLA